METTKLHRGRLIDHVHLVVHDLPASRRFYEALLKALEVPMGAAAKVISGRMRFSFPVPTAPPPKAI